MQLWSIRYCKLQQIINLLLWRILAQLRLLNLLL